MKRATRWVAGVLLWAISRRGFVRLGRQGLRATPVLCSLVALVGLLSGCSTLPREIYHGYSGPYLPDASLAIVDLGTAQWVRIDDLRVDRARYSAVKLRPGAYDIEFGRAFGVSFLVDPRMLVEQKQSATVTLEAGHTYRLQADRTYGRGYRVYFWIEDAGTGNVVYGSRKP